MKANNSTVIKFNAENDIIPQQRVIVHNGATVGSLVDSIIEENYQLSKELLKICFRNENQHKERTHTSAITALITLVAFITSIVALKAFL